MTKKIFRSFMLSAVAVLLAGVVIVMTCQVIARKQRLF